MSHQHYKKSVSHLQFIDVYRVCQLFDVADPAIQHAVKKLLCAGQRGAKNNEQDYREAIDSINRALQMISEDCSKSSANLGSTIGGWILDSGIMSAALMPEVKSASDWWIEWKGGDRPVPKAQVVDVRLRSGEILPDSFAGSLAWAHSPNKYDSDITHYRIVKDQS